MRAQLIAIMILAVGLIEPCSSAPQVQVALAKGDVKLATLELQIGSRGAAITLQLVPQKVTELAHIHAENPGKEIVFTVNGQVLVGHSATKRPVAPDSVFLRLVSADDACAALRYLFQ